MEQEISGTNQNNCKLNKTESLICYVIQAMSVPTETMISKVCYLCDYLTVKNMGHSLSSTDYKTSILGPQGKNISDCLYELVKRGIVDRSIEYSIEGNEYVKYSVREVNQLSEESQDDFSVEEMKIINEVLKSVSSLNARLLNEVVANTKPVKDVAKKQNKNNQESRVAERIDLLAYAPRS